MISATGRRDSLSTAKALLGVIEASTNGQVGLQNYMPPLRDPQISVTPLPWPKPLTLTLALTRTRTRPYP